MDTSFFIRRRGESLAGCPESSHLHAVPGGNAQFAANENTAARQTVLGLPTNNDDSLNERMMRMAVKVRSPNNKNLESP